MYLTYADYLALGGTLDEKPFERFEFKAEKYINAATFNRIKDEAEIREAVKMLAFELVELLDKTDETKGLITSESNDGYSVSYAISSQAGTESTVQNLIYQYLIDELKDGVSVLYRGVS